MARSVAVPQDAVKTSYAALGDDCFDFDDLVNDVRRAGMARYPSLSCCQIWNREFRAILENRHAYLIVSEYNDLVALSVVPKSRSGEKWCAAVDLDPLVELFGDRLIRVGTFSNGEQVFRPASGKQKGDLGLGFTSKEGWL